MQKMIMDQSWALYSNFQHDLKNSITHFLPICERKSNCFLFRGIVLVTSSNIANKIITWFSGSLGHCLLWWVWVYYPALCSQVRAPVWVQFPYLPDPQPCCKEKQRILLSIEMLLKGERSLFEPSPRGSQED